MINRGRLGVGCALAAASIYGFVPNFVRGAFNNGIPPVEATFFRTSAIAAAAGLLFGERLTFNQYAGGGIVLAALVVSCLLVSRETGV